MGIFSRPKLAQATSEETAKVKKELTKKYPAMMTDPDWGKPMKTRRTKQVEQQITASGLTPEEIKKLKGK